VLGVVRWCLRHRKNVVVAWVVFAVLATALAQAAGRHYSTNFTLPGTESQRALNLLKHEFKVQSGDVDTVVFHASSGTVYSASIRSAIDPLIGRLARMPHVALVVSPYNPRGAFQVSADKRTAFISLFYDKPPNQLANSTGQPVLNSVHGVHVPGLQVAAGGQVIEQAEGFTIGPATAVGALAALMILLITFGSLIAAGMPLITAAFGLVTGVAIIGLLTHVTPMPNPTTDLALMIGLGVGIDYALFIVTRFRESHGRLHDVGAAVVEAMDTAGRAILLAGTTVVIALLGMFATGVSFMYGLAIGSVVAVLLVMLASLTLLPALLSRFGTRLVAPRRAVLRRANTGRPPRESLWRRWSAVVQARPRTLALVSLVVMLAFVLPVTSLRLDNSDAGNDPSNTSTRQAFDLLARGFGPGFNGPLQLVAELRGARGAAAVPTLRATVRATPDVVAVTPPRISPSGSIAVLRAYPRSAPQAQATTDLVHRLREQVLPPFERRAGVRVLVGGFTAGSIDFAGVLSNKLPIFIAIVVVLSALLLFAIFRSLVIPLQAAAMNLLSIGGALGATVLVFQKGFLAGVLGVQEAPVEPWIPVIIFAVVFGLSMDYEVFLISRVREQWTKHGDASAAVIDGIAFTGRVITAAAAIMICVFLSFLLGNERALKEFGFGLAAAVFLDAIVVRCMLLPAVLELLGSLTWKLPTWLSSRLPDFNIEGSSVRQPIPGREPAAVYEEEREAAPLGS
jgi:putative drug exporter of the RND superfamily